MNTGNIFIKSTTELKILVYCNVMLHCWVRFMTLNPWKMKATCSSEMSDTSASPHHTRPESSITPL